MLATTTAPAPTAAPAPEHHQPPLREGESNWSLFVKGLHYAIDQWTIIELALAHGFGGKNTPLKIQTLEFEIRPCPLLPTPTLGPSSLAFFHAALRQDLHLGQF
jgi:hypothetical protein